MSISISNTTQSTGALWWKGEDRINQAQLTGSQNFKIRANVDANKVVIQNDAGEDLITFSRDGDEMNVERTNAFDALFPAGKAPNNEQLVNTDPTSGGFQLGQFDIRLEPKIKTESHFSWRPRPGTEDYSNHLTDKPDWTTGTIYITDNTDGNTEVINW